MAAAHDPGGKRLLPLAPDVVGSAVFGGPGDCYRYVLTRRWHPPASGSVPRVCLFIMMNPSTANPLFDDPTVQGVTRKVRRWGGYSELVVCNTFAYRATDQRELVAVCDPVGPDNDVHLMAQALRADTVVFAYGAPHPSLRNRGPNVARMLRRGAGIQPFVLRLSQTGVPCHPLYLPDNIEPFAWNP